MVVWDRTNLRNGQSFPQKQQFYKIVDLSDKEADGIQFKQMHEHFSF